VLEFCATVVIARTQAMLKAFIQYLIIVCSYDCAKSRQ
jgi:hypothetical protein